MNGHDPNSLPQPASPGAPDISRALEALIATPGRFSFDAAMTLLERVTGRPMAEVVHFHTAPGRATPWSDILHVRPRDDGTFDVTIGFGGLTGHDGVLPGPYGALADEQYRARAPAFAAFLDMLAQRPRAQFAEAGTKYIPDGSATAAAPAGTGRGIAQTLFALMGLDEAHAVQRAGIGDRHLLYFSGLIATRPRSAERLRTLLEEWVDAPVRIEQFAGQWVAVPPDQQSRLPGDKDGQYVQLGVDAVIGARLWDMNARIEIVLGPLPLDAFRAFLPAGQHHDILTRLIRLFVDDDVECLVRLGLCRDHVPAAQTGRAQLGAEGWLARSEPRDCDAYDVTFPILARPA
ncbi:hypothetical protein AA103196_1563 [Ameyamaea chiangmaiensis NBRC 103196]|uniref:Type VI secretion system baseplate subunit TssG n=1 Tax=Ameyamaea chiangmaiensis TaxID=442969 RepID=A0A850PE63_9PROT|nr:type VI secretion system baseplate subunit TssG [Ameyamaea chiangmaiensis]MBS4076088.1 type VI secretion system baseplate subunit TssG [Ameyamaea chiangmaiensis]NVN40979.1 type VI secretion system baseplate subunit TssG [Ameyamaea chiangmaiensis]GBQ66981.1 hypothetical protein AA103196_1563 [Ameyamaea chiangmaiensis NBRC 103196]